LIIHFPGLIDPAAILTPRGVGLLFSSLRSTSSLREFQKPLPIIVSNHMPLNNTDVNPTKLPIQGTTYIPLSAPIYEYSPFEFGSFDPQLSAFIPTEYLGTTLESGKQVSSLGIRGYFSSFFSGAAKNCVRGFDQMSFIMGSSAAVECSVVPTLGIKLLLTSHF
jgi:lysophospholipase